MIPRIFIPDDSGAVALGADKVAKAIAAELKARGIEAKIVRNGSRGAYFLEPLVEVACDKGRIAYGPVKPSDVKGLFDSGFLTGGHHKRWLGDPAKIPFIAKQTRLTFARCGIIDPLSLEAYERHGGLKGLRKAVTMDPAAIVGQVTESGLRGRGGAGFPTGIKWKTVLDTAADQKYIVCNADEGDSATFADRMIMEGDPFVLIEGMAIAGIATGATKGYIYIRSEYPHAVAKMNKAVGIARKAGVLGAKVLGSAHTFDMEVRVGGGYKMSFTNFTTGNSHSFGGTYLELKPNEFLRYNDRFDDPNLPGEMTTSVWLKKVSVGTEPTVKQEGIPEAIPAEACYLGWQDSLDKLMRLVEPQIPDGPEA